MVRRVRYDSAFTFIYSKRTGTPAAAMEDQVPEDVVKDRFDRLLKEVQDLSLIHIWLLLPDPSRDRGREPC